MPRRLPGATPALVAAPAVAGMAAAICLSPQALASTQSPQGTHATETSTAATVTLGDYQPGPQLAELMSVTWPVNRPVVVVHKTVKTAKSAKTVKSSQQVWYTVQAGDSLSAIAGRYYHDPAYWPVLYWANKNRIQSADLILPGQRLQVPAKPASIPAAPATATPAPVQAAAPVEAAAPAQVAAPVSSSASTPQSTVQAAPAQQSTTVNPGNYSGFQACVISRESGGNSQVMNSSGHYGLYQFSESTWVAYGGSAASFGNASVAEQNQVFANAMAAGGQSNWAPYDGC
jgi:LysM repeat protein